MNPKTRYGSPEEKNSNTTQLKQGFWQMDVIFRWIFQSAWLGTGLVLQTPSGQQMEYSIRIGFKATNNKAEYEALLVELRVATRLGVDFHGCL